MLSIYRQMLDTYLLEERVIIVMSLSNATDGFCSTIAWNCADKALFGDCQLYTGDEVQVVSSFFGNVIVRVHGRCLAINKDAAERIKMYQPDAQV